MPGADDVGSDGVGSVEWLNRTVGLSISMVPAPSCAVCAEPMEPVGDSGVWACQQDGCDDQGVEFQTQVFTFRKGT